MVTFLDNLMIELEECGRKTFVPALDPGWAEDRQFINYRPPPFITDTPNEALLAANQEQWMERMEVLSSDLEFLLQLTHHRFWSQIVFDVKVHICLESYLSSAMRTHDPSCYAMTEAMQRLQQKVHRLVFFVYVRMATLEESESCCISPAKFGELIYQHFLFDIPKLMDLCALYGCENKFAMQKMMVNVFNNNPDYEQDLKYAVDTLMQTLSSIEIKFGLAPNCEDEAPKKLTEYIPPVSCSDLSWKELLDMTFYLVDTWVTLHIFLDVYSRAAFVFLSEKFAIRMASFYETLVPNFVEEFKIRASHKEVIPTLDEAKKRLSFARVCMLKVFRGILESACFQPILENSDAKGSIICAEEFLETMTSVLSEKTFVLDYFRRYPFDEDVDLLTQSEVELDSSRLKYIETSISTIKSEAESSRHLKELSESSATIVNGDFSNATAVNGYCESSRKSPQPDCTVVETVPSNVDEATKFDGEELEGACAGPRVDGEELASLISQVKDIIADLSDGFVEACLEHYNYDYEKVINALLENSLPNCLEKLDRQLHRSVKPKAKANSAASVLAERKNVFDNDEFDVFSRDDVDKSRIHKGKKKDEWSDLPKNDSTLKSVTIDLATVYERNKQGDLIYDDEYDDTYDGNMIGPAESTGFDEFSDRRPFVVPRILAPKSEQKKEDKWALEEYASESAETNSKPANKDFCENPELARERYAQRRQLKDQQQGRVQKDYTGKAKGQGQDESVLKNRSNKEKNKSFHSNHNRRSGSDYKRSRGMFPS